MGTCGRCDPLIRPVTILSRLLEGTVYFPRTKRYDLAALGIERRVGEQAKNAVLELKRKTHSSIRPSLKAIFPFSLMDNAVGGFGGIGGDGEWE